MNKSLIILSIAALAMLGAEDGPQHKIEQKDKNFDKEEVTIKPGEKVVFHNDDSVTHNVFSNSKINPFNIKVQTPGSSSTVQFNDEGTTEVRCAIHPRMKLVVTVKK
jgi:plastocyanin